MSLRNLPLPQPFTDDLGDTYFGLYSISLTGEVRAYHNIHCTNCNIGGNAWINMTLVSDDKVIGVYCPLCIIYDTIEITTFKEIENSET